MQRLCTNAGLNIKATKGKLVIYDQSDYEQRPVVIEADYRDTSFTKWKLDTKTADTKYASCRVSYVEPATGACIEYTAYTEDYTLPAAALVVYGLVGLVGRAHKAGAYRAVVVGNDLCGCLTGDAGEFDFNAEVLVLDGNHCSGLP